MERRRHRHAALAPNVKISLSTDGGLTFPTVLAARTPNDGSQVVALPNISTTTARIKVEAVGNYFFDINDADFTIEPAVPTPRRPSSGAGRRHRHGEYAVELSSGVVTDDVPATVTATVDYGDGGGPAAARRLNRGRRPSALSHIYATPGTKTVTVEVTDAGALSGTDTATVTVTKRRPGPGRLGHRSLGQAQEDHQGPQVQGQGHGHHRQGVPTGTVQVYNGTKLLGTGTLKSNGKVTIKISKKKAKKLKVGKNTLTAKYLGSATVAPSQDDFEIKVKKKQASQALTAGLQGPAGRAPVRPVLPGSGSPTPPTRAGRTACRPDRRRPASCRPSAGSRVAPDRERRLLRRVDVVDEHVEVELLRVRPGPASAAHV